MAKLEIPFDPKLDADLVLSDGKWGIILAHGEKSTIDDGILKALAIKLREKRISSLRFNFPFRMEGKKRIDDKNQLDQAYLATWEFINKKNPEIKWCVGGHGIGGLTALRISGILMNEDGVPPVICLGYPMYPHNRPELVNTAELGALIGDALFCQGSLSKRGSFDRLQNQLRMMAAHAHISKISGANHLFEVDKKPATTVAYWISRDIEKFLNQLY